jgi:site-specific recombinase XerD
MAAALKLVSREAPVPEPSVEDFGALIDIVIPSVYNKYTRYRYGLVLRHLFRWMQENNMFFCRVTVQKYIAHKIKDDDWSNHTVNQFLSAVRHLTKESLEHELIPEHIAKRVISIRCMRAVSRRKGRWLTKAQVSKIFSMIDVSTAKGMRDLVIIGLMVGAGLRRIEVAALKCESLKNLSGRTGLYDVLGKGGKYRDIPIPEWLAAAIEQYQNLGNIRDGYLIRGMHKSGKLTSSRLRHISSSSLETVVKTRTAAAGCPVDPHDLRRTWAKLARANGAPLEQVSLALGHSSINVTIRYLNLGVDHTNPACDAVGNF